MCRLLAATAWEPRGVKIVVSLLPAFHSAASHDPLLQQITRRGPRHCHGYGYILLVDYGAGWETHYHRFDAATRYGPTETACTVNLDRLKRELGVLRSRLSTAEKAILILHARKASPGTPRGTTSAHPYHTTTTTSTGETLELYLAHNGRINHEPLAQQAGIDPQKATDSQTLTLWLAREIARGQPIQHALKRASAHTQTALVTAILLIKRDTPEIIYTSIYSVSLTRKQREYYKPKIINAPGARILVSPTILHYATTPPGSKILEPNGIGKLWTPHAYENSDSNPHKPQQHTRHQPGLPRDPLQ